MGKWSKEAKQKRRGNGNPNFKYNITKEFIVQEYLINKKSVLTISSELGCSNKPICDAIDKFKIPTRRQWEHSHPRAAMLEKHKKIRSEGMKQAYINNPELINKLSQKLSGINNPNWRGGISGISYTKFTTTRKKAVLKRDAYKCQISGISNVKHIKKFGCQLHIHHIDYDKDNYYIENLISLAKNIHSIKIILCIKKGN